MNQMAIKMMQQVAKNNPMFARAQQMAAGKYYTQM